MTAHALRRTHRATSPPLAHVLTLRDDRALAFCESGDPGGAPVLLFHGIPASRLFRHPDEALTRRAGVRLITIDRPGFGLSDPLSDRTYRDWAVDVTELLNRLGLRRVGVVGFSAGAPHAAVCAHELHARVTRGAIVAGNAPHGWGRPASGKTKAEPATGSAARESAELAAVVRKVQDDPAAFVDDYVRQAGPGEKKVFADARLRSLVIANAREAVRRGGRGFARELAMLRRPWGFAVDDIGVPFDLWYGDEDSGCPVGMGRYFARVMPRARLHVCKGEGHFLIFRHWGEILRRVAARDGA